MAASSRAALSENQSGTARATFHEASAFALHCSRAASHNGAYVAWQAIIGKNLLVVHSTVPVTSVQELIAFGKAKPKFLNYASSGVGTTSFLSGEIFKLKTGVDMIHVPYKGAGEATSSCRRKRRTLS
ncbi:MAG: hypothetical protein E6H46_12135 [Betaproteobacteria bacterium]|nr:MAG: hypothetical protein E6H46_12135 [Betaproteobacteria bacterium]